MKIQGVEIKKVATLNLLTQCRVYSFLIPFYFIFGAMFALCTLFALMMSPEDLESMWIIIPIGVIGAAVFTCVGICLLKKVKGIKTELFRRKISDAEKEAADRIVKGIFRGSIIILIVSVAIILVAIFASVNGNEDTNNSGSSNAIKCRNCGRTEDIVPGFRFCEDCYEGFSDWQEDNWNED